MRSSLRCPYGAPHIASASALIFVGRVGTFTFASALALRAVRRRYRYPEERPIVG